MRSCHSPPVFANIREADLKLFLQPKTFFEIEFTETMLHYRLNRCPPLAKAAIDSHFGGELIRVEGILNSKGLLSPEDKKTLDILRTNINFYMGKNSPLNKRLMARLQEGLESDFTDLIESKGMSAADKLNKIFKEVYPKYFPEDSPSSQELLQELPWQCFKLLFYGIRDFDLSGVEEDVRNAFLENLASLELDYAQTYSDSRLNQFLKLADAHPDYLVHLQSLRLHHEEQLYRKVDAKRVLSLLITPERTIFPRLQSLEVDPNSLPPNEGELGKIGTDYLLRVIRNNPSLKTVKIKAVYPTLITLLLMDAASRLPLQLTLDSEAVSRSFSEALGTSVTIIDESMTNGEGGGSTNITITIGERSE